MEDNIEVNVETENARLTQEHSQQGTFEIPEINKYEFEKWYFFSMSSSLAILILIISKNNPEYILICTIPVDFFKLFKNIKNRNDTLRMIRKKEILEDFCYITTKALGFLFIVNHFKPVSFVLIPLFSGIIISIFVKSAVFKHFQVYSEFVKKRQVFLSFKMIMCIAVALASLSSDIEIFKKTENLIKLIPVWIGLALMAIFALFQVFYLIKFSCIERRLTFFQCFGGIFINFSLFTVIVNGLVFQRLLIDKKYFKIKISEDDDYALLGSLLALNLSFVVFKKFIFEAVFAYIDTCLPDDLGLDMSGNSKTGRGSIITATDERVYLNKKSSSLYTQSDQHKQPKERHPSLVFMIKGVEFSHKRSLTQKELKKSPSTCEIKIEIEQCFLCFEKYANAVIMNCGHGGICFDCALNMQKEAKSCFLCRGEIEKILKIIPCIDGDHEVIAEYEEEKNK